MGKKLDPRETASFEEVLLSNVLTQEALINLLEAKGLISRDALLAEILRLKRRANNQGGKAEPPRPPLGG